MPIFLNFQASPIYKTHPAFPQLTDSPSLPQLQIGLRYAANEGKLMLLIQSLEHLPFNPYGTTGTCFIRILIVKDHKRRWRRKSNLAVGDLENGYEVSELTTRAVRRSAKTDFNEHFNVEITEKELRYAVIKMLVFGSDRGGHEALIGECHVSLGKQEFQSNETQEFTLKLYQSNEANLNIKISINILFLFLILLESRSNSTDAFIFANSWTAERSDIES